MQGVEVSAGAVIGIKNLFQTKGYANILLKYQR
jgi:hypothetical protein